MRQIIFLSGIVFFFILLVHNLFPIGIVGEVAAAWVQPDVIQQSNPVQSSALETKGPFTIRSTRPLISIGPLPISTNIYTSGIPDWPAAILFSLTSSATSVLYLNTFLGILLLLSIFFLLRDHLSSLHRYLILLLLCGDWMFLFYKKALGGTEILLQFSFVLCIAALLNFHSEKDASRQLGWGIGLGLLAKITFVLNLFPLLLTLLWIKPKHYALSRFFIPIAICSVPIFLTILLFMGIDTPVRSHDFFTLQWERILSVFSNENAPARENTRNILYWTLDPLPFFVDAYKIPEREMHWIWKGTGWFLAIGLLFWKRKDGVLKWLSLLLFTQILVLGIIAKDLHHLAMATPLLAIWIGCLCQALNGWKKFLFVLPWFIGNGQILADSPMVIKQVPTPSFSAEKQQQIVELLRQHKVQKVTTMDYEIYGVLEALLPEVESTHTWAAISHERAKALPFILQASTGGHLLILRASTGMIYNLRPSNKKLQTHAEVLGLRIEEVASMNDSLWLYQVQSK